MAKKKSLAPIIDLAKLPFVEFFIAGLVHHANITALSIEGVSETLDLVPEPTNRHDRAAIAVYDGPAKLGYVPAPTGPQACDAQRVIHEAVRHGCLFRTVVHNFAPTNPTHRMILVRVYIHQPEAPLLNRPSLPTF